MFLITRRSAGEVGAFADVQAITRGTIHPFPIGEEAARGDKGGLPHDRRRRRRGCVVAQQGCRIAAIIGGEHCIVVVRATGQLRMNLRRFMPHIDDLAAGESRPQHRQSARGSFKGAGFVVNDHHILFRSVRFENHIYAGRIHRGHIEVIRSVN